MKLNSLRSSTQAFSGEAIERVRHIDGRVRRVEAAEGVEGDRQRSLQQELAETDPKSLGDFKGSAQIRQEARELAAQLTLLGNHAEALVKLRALAVICPHIDDQA